MFSEYIRHARLPEDIFETPNKRTIQSYFVKGDDLRKSRYRKIFTKIRENFN